MPRCAASFAVSVIGCFFQNFNPKVHPTRFQTLAGTWRPRKMDNDEATIGVLFRQVIIQTNRGTGGVIRFKLPGKTAGSEDRRLFTGSSYFKLSKIMNESYCLYLLQKYAYASFICLISTSATVRILGPKLRTLSG